MQDRIRRHLGTLAAPSNVQSSLIWFIPSREHLDAVAALVRIGRPAVPALIRVLATGEDQQRYLACRPLARISGKDAVAPLIQAFRTDPRWQVRAEAGEALAKLKDPRAVAPLLAALEDRDSAPPPYAVWALRAFPEDRVIQALVRLLPLAAARYSQRISIGAEAARALGEMGRRARRILLEATASANPNVRRHAAAGLAAFGDREAREAVIRLLRDPDAEVRRNVAFGLGFRKERRAAQPLAAVLRDSNRDVVLTALEALVQIRTRRVAPAVIELLSSSDPLVPGAAARTLGKLRAREALQPLLRLLTSPDGFAQADAAEGLSLLRDRRSLEPLLAAVDDPSERTRAGVMCALGPLRDARAFQALLRGLKDQAIVRAAAAEGLCHQKERGAIPVLIRALEDPEAEVRGSAAAALGQLRAREAVEPLRRMMERDEQDYRLRSIARRALVRISGKKR